MSTKRTVGGDRLGSGNKQEVTLKGYERSKHNLTTTIATSQAVGTLVPIHNSIVLAGDSRELEIMAMCFTNPTEGPLYGSFKLQVDVLKADMRLYIAKLHMNLLDTGMKMSEIKFPQINMIAESVDFRKDPNNQQIGSSCIFKYLGMSGLGSSILSNTGGSQVVRQFNAIPWLMYWDVFKNYYANKQEEEAFVLHTAANNWSIASILEGTGTATTMLAKSPATGDELISPGSVMKINLDEGYTNVPEAGDITINFTDGTSATIAQMYESYVPTTSASINVSAMKDEYIGKHINNWSLTPATEKMPQLLAFPLENLDEIKIDILSKIREVGAYTITEETIAPFGTALETWETGEGFTTYSKLYSQEGLALKTYQSDLFNNWLNTEWIDEINSRSSVQVDTDLTFSMDNFLIKQKMYEWLNTIAMAGNTVDDYMEVTYDVKNTTRSEIPTFEGGLSTEIIFEPVVSNSAAGDQPLGTIAARGTIGGQRKGGTVRIHNNTVDHAYYMVIASITPRIMYTQGNRWETNLKTLDDLHKPAFDAIGYQDLITDQMVSWDTKFQAGGSDMIQYSAGKQLSWTNYMTEVDRAFGSFAEQTNEGWMILDRDYGADSATGRIKDLTTYIDPAKYNGVFAYEARDAQNFKMQYKIEDYAIRKMSANQMPRVSGI